MKQNRYLPFGYEITYGNICISTDEATIVKEIFEHYMSGSSYQSIADDLKKRQINYLENQCDWNKNRVKRILENKKYLGTKQMPKLIEEQLFNDIQELIQNKTSSYRETPTEVLKLRKLLCCDKCNKPLSRYITHNRDVWKCEEAACKVSMPKRMLEKKLLEIQNKITDNQDVIEPVISDFNTTRNDEDIVKLNEALKSEMNQSDLNVEKIKELIFEVATAAYDRIDDGSNDQVTNLIREKLSQAKLDETVNYDLISEITTTIYVTSEKSLKLKLKSDELVQ